MPENWSVRKEELLKLAADPAKRGSVFKELFEDSNSSNSQVGNFLTEMVAQVFPANFLGTSSKNRKVLN